MFSFVNTLGEFHLVGLQPLAVCCVKGVCSMFANCLKNLICIPEKHYYSKSTLVVGFGYETLRQPDLQR